MDNLQLVQREVSQDVPDVGKLVQIKNGILDAAKKIAKWVGHKCDLAADEFAKQVGKTLADAKFLTVAWLEMSGRLDQIVAALGGLLS